MTSRIAYTQFSSVCCAGYQLCRYNKLTVLVIAIVELQRKKLTSPTGVDTLTFSTPVGYPARPFQALMIRSSQLSTNGHSGKRTALLTDAFSNPRFTSQYKSVFTYSRKRTLSRKRSGHLKIELFFCLPSLVVDVYPMCNNRHLAMKFAVDLQ